MNRQQRRQQKRAQDKRKTQLLNQDIIDFNTARKDFKNHGSSDEDLVFQTIHELKDHMEEINVPFSVLPPRDFFKVVAIELANYCQPKDPNAITGMMAMLTHDLLEICNMDIDDAMKAWKKELDENFPDSFITMESEPEREAVNPSILKELGTIEQEMEDLVTVESVDEMDDLEQLSIKHEYDSENHHSLTDELIEKLIADGKIPQEEIDKLKSEGIFDNFDLVWNSYTEEIHSRPERFGSFEEEEE